MPKLVRRSRIIRRRSDNAPMTKTHELERPQLSTASQRVMALPQYKKVVTQLQKGVSVPKIVTWFDNEGWLGTMSPSTFTQYLYKFKTECEHIIEKPATKEENYDYYAGGASLPEVDALAEIDKLILAQRRRISMEMSTEIGIGKLFESTSKDIKVMGDLLAIKAQMEGKGTGPVGGNMDTATTLRNLRVDESARDRMQELTVQLIEGIGNASAKNNKKAKRVRA